MKRLLLVLLLVWPCSDHLLAQTPAGRGGGGHDLDLSIIAGAGGLFGYAKASDTQGSLFNHYHQRLAGFNVRGDGSVKTPIGHLGAGYAGEFGFDSGNARLTSSASNTTRRETVVDQLHILNVGYEPTPKVRIGVGGVCEEKTREWNSPSTNSEETRICGFGFGGGGIWSPTGKFSLDYQVIGAPWAKERRITDLNSTTVFRGIPITDRTLITKHYDAAAIVGGVGFTLWFRPHLGTRAGFSYFTSSADVPQTPPVNPVRHERFNRLAFTVNLMGR